MTISPNEEFAELSYYTLGHSDVSYFIHQHIVDAFQAQTADKTTKPISVVFSLIGLYLYLDKKYTGRQIQQAHMKLSQRKRSWAMPDLPEERGTITVSDVLKIEPGVTRDIFIAKWCCCVWAAYKSCHKVIATIARTELGVE
jgi:Family of unknown function (DUF5946)